MKKLLALGLVLTMLCGCTQKEEPKVTVCSGTSEGVEVVNTIKYEGDKVNSITYQNTTTFNESLYDYVENAAKQHEQAYSNITGITYAYTMTETTVIETITVDYNVADLGELVSLGIVDMGEQETVDYINYDLTIQSMSDLGLTCTEQ